MTAFEIELSGDVSPEQADAVREAFEIAVRAVRGALEEAGLEGSLTLDGVPYSADDVTEEAAAADTEETDEDEDEDEDDAPTA